MKLRLSLSRDREDEIRDSGMDAKAFQTYIYPDINTYYRVSTCYRQSSCMYPSWFYETFVWKGTPNNSEEKEEWITCALGGDHLEVVKNIVENGTYIEPEED